MNVLSGKPYYLKKGDRIVARARAHNKHGPGEFHADVASPFMMRPLAKDKLTLTRRNSGGKYLTLVWDRGFETSDVRPGQNFGYSIYWDQGGNGGEMVKLAYTTSTSYILRTYNSSKSYRFKLRPCFPCGCGPYSDVLTV